jgi:hypothetical protein
MSLAFQSLSDPRAASWFLAERQEARLLRDGTLLVRCVNEGDVSMRLLTPGPGVSANPDRRHNRRARAVNAREK